MWLPNIGVKCKVYSSPYHPDSNGRIEGFLFLKAYVSKYVSKSLEWDQVILWACTAFNLLPNEHSKESSLFLMFGRDPVVLLNSLLMPAVRYLGTDENILSRSFKEYVPVFCKHLGTSLEEKGYQSPRYLIENLARVIPFILLMDHTASMWDPRYTRDYQIVSFPRKTQVEVADSKGKVKILHILDVKYVLPAERVTSKLSDYQSFGRQSKLRIDPKDDPQFKMGTCCNCKYKFFSCLFKVIQHYFSYR